MNILLQETKKLLSKFNNHKILFLDNIISANLSDISNLYLKYFNQKYNINIDNELFKIYNNKEIFNYIKVIADILYNKLILLDDIYCPECFENGMFNFIIHLFGIYKYKKNITTDFIYKYDLNTNYFENSLRHYDMLIKLYKKDTGKFGIHDNSKWWIKSHIENTMFTFGSIEIHKLDNIPIEIENYCNNNKYSIDDIMCIEWLCDDKLIIENIDKNLNDAIKFIKMYYGKYPKIIIGKSWFFNPYIKDYLPNSNIAKLLNYFSYISDCKYDANNPAGLFWVFGKTNCNIYKLKIDNIMKQTLLNIVIDGKKLIEGIACVKVNENGNIFLKGI